VALTPRNVVYEGLKKRIGDLERDRDAELLLQEVLAAIPEPTERRGTRGFKPISAKRGLATWRLFSLPTKDEVPGFDLVNNWGATPEPSSGPPLGAFRWASVTVWGAY